MTDQNLNNQTPSSDQNQTPPSDSQSQGVDPITPDQSAPPTIPSGATSSSEQSQTTPPAEPNQEEEPSFPLEDFVSDIPAPPISEGPSSQLSGSTQTPPPSTTTAQAGTSSGQPTAPDAPQAPQQAPSIPTTQAGSSEAPQTQAPGPQQASVPGNQPPPSVPKEGFTSNPQPQQQASTPQAPSQAPTMPVQAPRPPSSSQKIGKGAVIRRSSSTGKVLLTILFSLLALSAVFFFFFYRVTFSFNVSPEGYKATIDGREIKEKVVKLNPGFHTVKIEKDGYISYLSSKDFSIGERADLSIELKKAITTQIYVSGAQTLDLSKSGNLINFLGQDSRLYYVAVDEPQAQAIALSNQQFPGLREILYSPNNDFALILDNQNLKIADFSKIDPTTQEEATNLPPASSAITTLTWNESPSAFVKKATSKVLYDLKTPTSWDLFLMDMETLQSQIIMRVDPTLFPSLNVDWGESAKTALITGKKAGILDIGKRDFTQFDEEFVFGQWGPNGKVAILQKADNSIYILKDNKVESLDLKAKRFFFSSDLEAYFLQENSLIMVNFDTLARINYAEISGLSQTKDFAVAQENIYFLDDEGIKSAKLQRGVYGEEQTETN